jgi:hypothetical protein
VIQAPERFVRVGLTRVRALDCCNEVTLEDLRDLVDDLAGLWVHGA